MPRGKKGVPVKYKSWWAYRGTWKEIKTRPGHWKIKFRAGKQRRGGKGGSHPPGRKITWIIRAKQYVIKRKNKNGKIRYDTLMVGTKRLKEFGYQRPRFYRKRR